MDILEQYNKNNQQVPVRQPSYRGAEQSEGFLIRTVIKLSGGKMQDRRQALVILLVLAGAVLLVAVILIMQNTGPTEHPVINAPPPETIGQQNQLGQ